MKISKSSIILFILAALFMLFYVSTSYLAPITYSSNSAEMTLKYIIRPLCVYLSILFVIISIFWLVFINFSNQKKSEAVQIENIEKLRKQLIQQNTVNKDIIELMLSNMAEIRQYYAISKSQTRLSFALATSFSGLGFLLFVVTIYRYGVNTIQPVSLGVVSGAICELFAGTALLVYRDSLRQLNQYYKSLHENERFLSAVNLVERLSKEKQSEVMKEIILSTIKDISAMVQMNNSIDCDCKNEQKKSN